MHTRVWLPALACSTQDLVIQPGMWIWFDGFIVCFCCIWCSRNMIFDSQNPGCGTPAWHEGSGGLNPARVPLGRSTPDKMAHTLYRRPHMLDTLYTFWGMPTCTHSVYRQYLAIFARENDGASASGTSCFEVYLNSVGFWKSPAPSSCNSCISYIYIYIMKITFIYIYK